MYLGTVGGEVELMEGLIGHAKTYGLKVMVNPGMGEIEKIRSQMMDDGLQIFRGVEVLMMNREEAAALLELPLQEEAVWQGTWQIEGPHWVVVTDGKAGGLVMGEQKRLVYKAERVEAVEETGAGDAFGTGLAYALMQGKDIETAIAWGKKQAGSVIAHMGAKQGLLRATDFA